MPPVASKMKDTRYLHIHEADALDEAQLADWVKHASELPRGADVCRSSPKTPPTGGMRRRGAGSNEGFAA